MIKRTAGDGARVINAPHGCQSVLIDGLALLFIRGEAHVPFAEHGGSIALLLQQTGERQAALVDQARSAHASKYAAVVKPKSHAPGEQAVAGRRANGRGTVRIGEANALACEPVEMRRGHLALSIVAAHITVAEIVGKDEKDVWLVSGKC